MFGQIIGSFLGRALTYKTDTSILNEVDNKPQKKDNTALIVVGSSVLILVIIIVLLISKKK